MSGTVDEFLLMCYDFLHISEAAENPYGEDDNKSPFPVQPQVKRSYAQNVTVWIKASGLQVLLNHTEMVKKVRSHRQELLVQFLFQRQVWVCVPLETQLLLRILFEGISQ